MGAEPQLEMQPWEDQTDRYYRGGQGDPGGRVLHFTAKGTRDHVRHVHFGDQQTQANRDDALKVLQQPG